MVFRYDKDMKKTEKYESNPFSITFSGMDRFVQYARSVFITLVVLSMFGAVTNIADLTNSNGTDDTQITYENNTLIIESEDSINEVEIEDETSLFVFIASTAVIAFTLGVLLVTLFNTIYSGTVAAAANAAMKKEKISIWEAMRKMGGKFGILYLALLMATVKTIGGLLLFIVPGIRAALRYSALPYIIMSEDIGSDAAIEKSKKLYRGHLMEVFGIITVGGIIPFVGSSLQACGLSLSVSQLKSLGDKKPPKTHWLNYIGILIFLGFILLATIFSLLIVAVF